MKGVIHCGFNLPVHSYTDTGHRVVGLVFEARMCVWDDVKGGERVQQHSAKAGTPLPLGEWR